MLIHFFEKWKNFFIGWFETFRYSDHQYNYVIDQIELRQENNRLLTYIRYKLIGCRTLLCEPAAHLNTSHLFSRFRPDHAQIIVSIATVEALLEKNPNDIKQCYQKYIQHCSNTIKATT